MVMEIELLTLHSRRTLPQHTHVEFYPLLTSACPSCQRSQVMLAYIEEGIRVNEGKSMVQSHEVVIQHGGGLAGDVAVLGLPQVL